MGISRPSVAGKTNLRLSVPVGDGFLFQSRNPRKYECPVVGRNASIPLVGPGNGITLPSQLLWVYVSISCRCISTAMTHQEYRLNNWRPPTSWMWRCKANTT